MVDVNLVEEVIKDSRLVVRSELDVLDAIIRWLVKAGHRVKEEFVKEYLSSPTWGSKSEGTTIKSRVRKDWVTQLTRHIRVREMSSIDLRKLVVLCQDAR